MNFIKKIQYIFNCQLKTATDIEQLNATSVRTKQKIDEKSIINDLGNSREIWIHFVCIELECGENMQRDWHWNGGGSIKFLHPWKSRRHRQLGCNLKGITGIDSLYLVESEGTLVPRISKWSETHVKSLLARLNIAGNECPLNFNYSPTMKIKFRIELQSWCGGERVQIWICRRFSSVIKLCRLLKPFRIKFCFRFIKFDFTISHETQRSILLCFRKLLKIINSPTDKKFEY